MASKQRRAATAARTAVHVRRPGTLQARQAPGWAGRHSPTHSFTMSTTRSMFHRVSSSPYSIHYRQKGRGDLVRILVRVQAAISRWHHHHSVLPRTATTQQQPSSCPASRLLGSGLSSCLATQPLCSRSPPHHGDTPRPTGTARRTTTLPTCRACTQLPALPHLVAVIAAVLVGHGGHHGGLAIVVGDGGGGGDERGVEVDKSLAIVYPRLHRGR